MRKVIGSALLLLGLCGLALWSQGRLTALCGDTEALLARSEALLAEEDWEAAERFAAQARLLWRDRENYTRLFLRHDALDGLNERFIAYETELRRRDPEAAFGALRLLRARMEAILDEERFSLKALI